jgi:hypothetical protein
MHQPLHFFPQVFLFQVYIATLGSIRILNFRILQVIRSFPQSTVVSAVFILGSRGQVGFDSEGNPLGSGDPLVRSREIKHFHHLFSNGRGDLHHV